MSINAMPVEILITLFHYLAPKNPVTLLLVCRMWKDILYSMSDLWTSIRIYQRDTMPLLDIVSTASKKASRAGMLPLSVYWDIGVEEEGLTDAMKNGLMEFFKNAPTSRWRSLTLLNSVGIIEEIFDVGFPSLEILTLPEKLDKYSPRVLMALDETATSIKGLNLTHNYERFRLRLPGILGRVDAIQVPRALNSGLPVNITRLRTNHFPGYLGVIQHIKELILDEVGLSRLDDIQLPTLEYLEVGGEPYYDNLSATLNFPNLLHLKMPANAPFLLTSIIAPQLRHLHLQTSSSVYDNKEEQDELELDEDDIRKQYLNMSDSSRFPESIETLVITHPFEARVVFSLLINASGVSKLDVTVRGMMEAIEVVRYLLPVPVPETRGTYSLCPELRYLVVRHQGKEKSSGSLKDLCRSVLKSRNSSGFKNIKIVQKDGIFDVLKVE